MSTITVVRKNGYAAIAADTLAKSGYAKESADYLVNHEKILRYADSYIAIAGSMSVSQSIEHYLQTLKRSPRLHSIASIFSLWLKIHRTLKEDYYLNTETEEEDSVQSSQTDALIANPSGIYSVNAYRSVIELTKFYATGSGYEYALGAMYAVYNDERYSAEEIARLGVAAGREFDDGTGTPITSYTIRLRAKKR